MNRQIAIGADIGGSHITCQLFDLESHQFIGEARIRKSVDSNSSAPVILDSWANALREAAKYLRLLAITLGTGFGTTFIEDHKPVAEKYGIPTDGFLYRVPFKNSVADDYFSTRWFIKEYKAITGKEISGVKQLADLAINDNSAAMIFHTFGSGLGKFLTPWLQKFNAECLVIGGNISSAYPLFSKDMLDEFSQAGLRFPVFISSMPEDAAIAGSAFLCDNSFYQKLLQKI